jgi:hypothetical protein
MPSEQYGVETLSSTSVYDWFTKFSEGREKVIQNIRRKPSSGKNMIGIFRDLEGTIHVDVLPLCSKINAQYYSNLLCNAVSLVICKKQTAKLPYNFIVQLENASPQRGNLIRTTLAAKDWEIARHHPYNPHLAPGDFHFLGH